MEFHVASETCRTRKRIIPQTFRICKEFGEYDEELFLNKDLWKVGSENICILFVCESPGTRILNSEELGVWKDHVSYFQGCF